MVAFVLGASRPRYSLGVTSVCPLNPQPSTLNQNMRVLGLDIGGANIKAATETAEALSIPLEIWRSPDRLIDVLVPIIDRFSVAELLAVTMTAELADCFSTKSDGIDRVLRTVEVVAGKRPIRVWQTSGEFASTQEARDEPRLTAAANWHAQATFVGRLVPRGSALLIDIGSTTTDLIPLVNGLPLPTGRTDIERLQSGELVYCGVRRTPLCALTDCVPLAGNNCAVAAELFATIFDVYLTLGDIPENSDDCLTANGRPATLAAAHDRIARSVGGDTSEITFEDTRRIAEHIAAKQLQRLCEAADNIASRMSGPCENVLISGSGSFLAQRVAANAPRLKNATITSLPELFGPRVSDAACAFAVAKLAAERELQFLG
ncbi:MAG: H4MPT-linked C1 transfer pathway protein [Planctomycetes bacterium]|nr:H4MPT-linked C1 transfer pathway protein [Planctomycetota bacterium]